MSRDRGKIPEEVYINGRNKDYLNLHDYDIWLPVVPHKAVAEVSE